MSVDYGNFKRPLISLSAEGCFLHDGELCRVVMTRNRVSVGCSDITIGAMRELMRRWESKFNEDSEVVIKE